MFFEARGADPDLFARMAAGRIVAEQGAVATVDPFAYTPKKELWIDHEWLSGVVFYHIWIVGGDLALFLFKCMMALFTIICLYAAQQIVAPAVSGASFWLLLGVLDIAVVWVSTVRSQVFTYALLAYVLWAYVVLEQRGKRWPLMMMPLLMCCWANAHGGFVVGLGFLGIMCCGELLRRREQLPVLLWAFLGSIAATALNPYGFRAYWAYVLDAVSMQRPTIGEWARLDPLSVYSVIPGFFLTVILWALLRRKVQLGMVPVLMGILALYFGASHVRLLPILSMVCVIYGASSFEALLAAARDRFGGFFIRLEHAAVIAFLGVALYGAVLFSSALVAARGFSLDHGMYPVAALNWLKEHRDGGKLLVDFNIGSYALWTLPQGFFISVDGRYEEVYPQETVDIVSAALNPRDPRFSEALKKVWPDFILLHATGTLDATIKDYGDAWQTIYRDEKYALLGLAAKDKG